MELSAAQEALEKKQFQPCSATQEKSFGWSPARAKEHGALIESIGGQWILNFISESKILPSSVVAEHVQEKANEIEAQSGRIPGRKELRDIKDEVRLSLLPMAFTKRRSTIVWINLQAGFLGINVSSVSAADDIITSLVESLPGFAPRLLQTKQTPSAAMTEWLLAQEAPGAFSLGNECELKAMDESRAVVRYSRHPLEIEEIRQHIESGKRPTKLALNWGENIQFVLTDVLQLNKLRFSDEVLEKLEDGEDHFDSSVALETGELQQLLPQLIEALGGEEVAN